MEWQDTGKVTASLKDKRKEKYDVEGIDSWFFTSLDETLEDGSLIALFCWHSNEVELVVQEASESFTRIKAWYRAVGILDPHPNDGLGQGVVPMLRGNIGDSSRWSVTKEEDERIQPKMLKLLHAANSDEKNEQYDDMLNKVHSNQLDTMGELGKRQGKIERAEATSSMMNQNSAKFKKNAETLSWLMCKREMWTKFCACLLPLLFITALAGWLYKTLTLKDVRG